MSNEFNNKSLQGAVGQATLSYRRRRACPENKGGESCNDLVLEISGLQREAGRLSDEASRLEGEADDLRRRAFLDLGFAGLAALGSPASAARGAALGLRMIASRSARSLTRRDVYDLLSLFGPIGAALQAVIAALELAEAERLSDLAEDLISSGERLGDELLAAVEGYERSGCGAADRLQS